MSPAPRAWLGLTTSGLSPTLKNDGGRLVVSLVRRGTPAYEAGVNVDDEILALGEYRVRPDGWEARLEAYRPGDRVTLLVARRERIMEFRAGNAFDVAFGGPYDAVLLTNFLHHFDEATCITLLKKIRAALKSGGITAVLEFVPNEDRVTPPDAARFSMMMPGTTASGDAYTYRDLERMHMAAGFEGLALNRIEAGAESIVVGRT